MAKKTYTIVQGTFHTRNSKKERVIKGVGDTITLEPDEAEAHIERGALIAGKQKVDTGAAENPEVAKANKKAEKAAADLKESEAANARLEGIIETLRADHGEAVEAAEKSVDEAIAKATE